MRLLLCMLFLRLVGHGEMTLLHQLILKKNIASTKIHETCLDETNQDKTMSKEKNLDKTTLNGTNPNETASNETNPHAIVSSETITALLKKTSQDKRSSNNVVLHVLTLGKVFSNEVSLEKVLLHLIDSKKICFDERQRGEEQLADSKVGEAPADTTNLDELLSSETSLNKTKLTARGINELSATGNNFPSSKWHPSDSTSLVWLDWSSGRSNGKKSYLQSKSVKRRRRVELKMAQSNFLTFTPKIPTNNGEFTDKRSKKRTGNEWPIIYSKQYDVNLFGLEKLHPFDSKKWRNIFNFLKKEKMLSDKTVSVPEEATYEILCMVHTTEYLNSLKSSHTVARIIQIPRFSLIPSFIIERRYLKPMRFQVGGTILAGELALHRGWAINLGGGFHHASKDSGAGNCPYADITLLIKWLFKYYPRQVKSAMIVDLDAHQGDGHEKDFSNERHQVFIMDVYNPHTFEDFNAKIAISRNVELDAYANEDDYLYKVESHLEQSLKSFHPDILVYNAGTDVLTGDPLGHLDVSAQGIIRRDEIVFTKARARNIPIVMLTSGGYQKSNANIIAKSILNLKKQNLIFK